MQDETERSGGEDHDRDRKGKFIRIHSNSPAMRAR
jgi:hypothetical protein